MHYAAKDGLQFFCIKCKPEKKGEKKNLWKITIIETCDYFFIKVKLKKLLFIIFKS